MSANHTRLDKKDYQAKIRELMELENSKGNLQAARQKIQSAVDSMDRKNNELAKQAQGKRAEFLKKIQEVEYESRRAFKVVDDRVVQDTEKIDTVLHQSQALAQECQTMIASMQSLQGAKLMAQTVLDFRMCQSDPDYRKFAPIQMAALDAKIREADRLDQNPTTMLQGAMSLTKDLYALDLTVSGERQRFERLQLESQGLAEAIMGKIQSARKSIHYGDEKSDLVDFDYWTDGQLALVEEELKTIARRLEEKRYDESYGYEELEKDRRRLDELDRIQLLLVQDAIEKSTLSEARESMGGLIASILHDKHYFEVVGAGFDGGDLRECYIMRLKRDDGAEIEVLINPNSQNGDNDLYYRINMSSYVDSSLMATIQQSIAQELREYGIQTTASSPCSAEPLESFNSAMPKVSEAARQRHNIQKRSPVQLVKP